MTVSQGKKHEKSDNQTHKPFILIMIIKLLHLEGKPKVSHHNSISFTTAIKTH